MNLVEIKGLVKSYGSNKAVNNINLNIPEGSIYGLLGPNGAGKSTTINMICGLITPNKGEIKIFGKKFTKKSKDIKHNIGIVPQDIAIYEDLTAYENVAFFGGIYGLNGRLLKQRANKALEFVGLLDRKNEYPGRFSGGMKRRLNIACALVHQPKLIIMDEPTVGIDPQSRNHILESIKKLNEKGCTIIYTSHYMEEVEEICTNVAIVDKGHIIAEGEKYKLISEHTDINLIMITVEDAQKINLTVLKEIIEAENIELEKDTLQITCKSSEISLNKVIEYFIKNDVKVRNIENKSSDLETIFLKLTGKKLRD
ncbi:ABC transporter ATP-binding protein [Clostridium tarantellae]|uniref:ATP-binding cassette domain-containing protein n=1 Tax=Clostridium tarantellae TaxID=39493 RepID=A0A6I1MLC1_9CLOT|nr:ABC transporter ATP-binding protein [Clostridium tarantellae]MPQ43784.1 ATP-binding cassette domain-containing protein [Clostridium tarantellae]